ncbi:hypothetical protein [Hyphomonas sp.]|uniref:hypothetical protein n=1 Tax=Hyphomonas sp. TaxID=87 RepID=UPI0025BAA88D|nr:hypothetical protein [Hyphomonas sp.]
MIHRAVKSVTPFDFRSDFSPAQPVQADPDPAVSLTTPELLQMLAEARAEGAEMAKAEAARADLAHLQTATNALNEALANLVALTGHLEACAYEEGFSERAHALVRATARTILDGQGDLFAAQHSLKTGTLEGTP